MTLTLTLTLLIDMFHMVVVFCILWKCNALNWFVYELLIRCCISVNVTMNAYCLVHWFQPFIRRWLFSTCRRPQHRSQWSMQGRHTSCLCWTSMANSSTQIPVYLSLVTIFHPHLVLTHEQFSTAIFRSIWMPSGGPMVSAYSLRSHSTSIAMSPLTNQSTLAASCNTYSQTSLVQQIMFLYSVCGCHCMR